MTTIVDLIVKTRKAHCCWGCGREFPAGTDMQFITTVDGGDLISSYWCPVCQVVWSAGDYRDGDGIPFKGLKDDDQFWEYARQKIEGNHDQP